MAAEVTSILGAIARGDRQLESALPPALEGELRRLTSAWFTRHSSRPDLQPTVPFDGTYMQLIEAEAAGSSERIVFIYSAARALRRTLAEQARAATETSEIAATVLALDDALTRLAACDPLPVVVAELCFFGGRAPADIAGDLGLTPESVEREWRFARAWLHAKAAPLGGPEQLESIRSLFSAALDLSEPNRRAALENRGASDPALRDVVERLLTADRSPGLLDDAIHIRPPAARPSELKRIGPYELQTLIGRGGMGQVYRAVDERLGRSVALKVRPVAASHREGQLSSEARAASALNHPNVATIFDAGAADGYEYVAMELIAGTPLQDWIGPQGMRLDQAVDFARQIADALVATHAAGIVHQDLKPQNVMITDRRQVKVLDFGVAAPAVVAAFAAPGRAGTSALVAGTPCYMSPEQASGTALDTRSDLFSFGALLYEMVTGRQPFRRTTNEACLAAVLREEPPRPIALRPDLPLELDRLICRCLTKNRDERIGSAAEIASSLAAVAPASAPAESPAAPRVSAGYRIRPLLLAGLAAIALVVWSVSRQEVATQPVLTQLTFDAGLTAYPHLSTDGKLLVYASDRGEGGSLDIWLRQVQGSHNIRLSSDPADDYDPALSPDGTRVVYRSERGGGGLYSVSALGGESRLIAAGGRQGRFSPDGKWIAYWTGDPGRSFLPGSARLFVLSVEGGEPRELRTDFSALCGPVWTPGGDIIALGRSRTDRPLKETLDWWFLPSRGGEAVGTGVLAALAAQKLPIWEESVYPSAWVPGKSSVLLSTRLAGSNNIWEVDIHPRTHRVVGAARRLTFGAGVETQPMAAAGAGSPAIGFAALTRNVDVWSAPREAPDRLGAPVRVTSDLSVEAFPSVSRDGRRLAFTRVGKDADEIVIRDAATPAERVLLSTVWFAHARLSTDGRSVAVWNNTEKQGSIIDIDSGVARQFCSRCTAATSISGSMVVYESVAEPHALIAVDLQTKRSRTLVESSRGSNGIPYAGELSPNGKWIAFHVSESSPRRRRVYIASTERSAPARENDWIPLTPASTLACEPTWSADGRQVYYVAEDDGFRCIWMRRLTGPQLQPDGSPQPVLHLHRARIALSAFGGDTARIGLSVARDRVVFSVPELTGNIWIRREEARQ